MVVVAMCTDCFFLKLLWSLYPDYLPLPRHSYRPESLLPTPASRGPAVERTPPLLKSLPSTASAGRPPDCVLLILTQQTQQACSHIVIYQNIIVNNLHVYHTAGEFLNLIGQKDPVKSQIYINVHILICHQVYNNHIHKDLCVLFCLINLKRGW